MTILLMFASQVIGIGLRFDGRVEITGIFRAVPVRANSRRRATKALYKTYVDILHVKKSSKKRLGVDSSIVARNEYVVK